MEGTCYKCKQEHGITKLISDGGKAAQAAEEEKAARPYTSVKKALHSGRGCVFESSGDKIAIIRGQEAWKAFKHPDLQAWRYDCLRCNACRFVHALVDYFRTR